MRACLLAALFLAGCARRPTPARAGAQASDAAVLAPSAVATQAGPTASEPGAAASDAGAVAQEAEDVGPAPPIPAAPPGIDPEKVKLVASICAAATFKHPFTHELEVGCRSHPPWNLPEQRPDGKLPPFTDDPLRFCALEKIYKGSFSRPGAKQAALSFSQCKENDPDATWDMGFPGNMVLVEEVAGRWKVIRYALGINTPACLSSRRTDGREVLLCRSGFSAGSAGTVDYFFAVDFDPAKKTTTTLAKIFSNDFDCAQVDMLGFEHGLVAVRVADVALADVNKDGVPDLVVQVLRARAAPSSTLEARVRAACKQLPRVGAAAVLPAMKKTTLQLVGSDAGFAPSAASKAALDAWESEAPEGFNGLVQAAPQ